MRTLLSNTAFFLLFGCATVEAPTEARLSIGEALSHPDAPPEVEKLPTPEVFARSFRRVTECEEQARTFQERAPDAAWAYLKACAARGRFALLPQLLEYWRKDVKQRPDAAQLLASAVAARGLLKADLIALQQQGLAFFDLASAIDRPLTYRGRTVLFFGQIRGSYEDAKSSTVEIDEIELASAAGEAVESPRFTTETSSRVNVNGQLQSPLVGGRVQGTVQRDATTTRGRTSLRFDTVVEKTGHDVIGRLPKNDPFLASGHPWLFVAKFDDVWRPDRDDAERRVPVVSIVSWHELSPPAWSANAPPGF